MNNTTIIGIENVSEISSELFAMNMIHENIELDKDIKSISKITLSSKSQIIDSFNITGNYYINVQIKIRMKIDYIATDSTINYKFEEISNIANIYLKDLKPQLNMINYCNILDCDILDIKNKSIKIYILYLATIQE